MTRKPAVRVKFVWKKNFRTECEIGKTRVRGVDLRWRASPDVSLALPRAYSGGWLRSIPLHRAIPSGLVREGIPARHPDGSTRLRRGEPIATNHRARLRETVGGR